jgi:hypothetical protein
VLRVAVVCALILAIAGVARVALAAQAAEAAIDAWALKTELKGEQMRARGLEADRGSLSAPSRIEVLACETLNMGRPVEVCYLELPSTPGVPADEGAANGAAVAAIASPGESSAEPGAASRLVSTLVELAAGEAQVLLVGDMGLGLGR